MSTQLTGFLPYILIAIGIVLVALWIWLSPAKDKAVDATDVIEPIAEVAPPVATPPAPAAKVPATPKAPAKPKTTAKPKAAAKPVTVEEPAPAKKAPAAKPVASAKPAAKPAAKAVAAEKPVPAPKATKAAVAPKPVAAASGPDNLLLIKGLGPKLKTMLNAQGIERFDQIAAWSEADVIAVDQSLGAFAGRIARDNFVDQARLLAKGDIAAFEAAYGKLDAGMR